MAVLGLLSLTLEVPELEPGVKFYSDAGLTPAIEGHIARFRCPDQSRDCLTLLARPGQPKRLHHIQLRAEALADIAARIEAHGGMVIDAQPPFANDGLWVRDPHGTIFHLIEHPQDPPPLAGEPFAINAPGRITRVGRSAMLPTAHYGTANPLRLGHVLLFSPDVEKSVAFLVGAFGMGLADQAQDIIAFCCARHHSDHHVIAFAKSTRIGFHHASFQLTDPDAVGRAGLALRGKSDGGDWGFGRHTIGSNFFHYIQDPWGSWFEYYSDMDFIDDYNVWTPTNYEMEDSLANWGPEVPPDFVHNYETES